MAPATLSSLSPELICLILQKVHSGHDLYAFLRTSSYIHQAFAASKDLILWNLARSSMVPEVLVEAVTAVKLRNMECSLHEVDMKFEEISALAAEEIINSSSRRALPHKLMSSADLLTLRQLQSAVEYFIDGYCSCQLPILFSPGKKTTSDLSVTELARLQRAFYRYDICQTIWYYPGRFQRDLQSQTSRYDARLLLSRLKPWEVEEIACVWHHINQRLEDMFDKQGQTLLESIVLTSDSKQTKTGGSSTIKLDQQADCGLRPRFKELSDDFVFSEDGKAYRPAQVTFLASRPLPFLQALFESGQDKQRRMMFEYQVFELDHLCTLLRKAFHTRLLEEANFEGDKVPGCNRAWPWAQKAMAPPFVITGVIYHRRTWGYVFWDEGRIESSGLLDKSKSAWEIWEPTPRSEHSGEPSVEQ